MRLGTPFVSAFLAKQLVAQRGLEVATVILTFFLLSSKQPFISARALALFGGTGRRIRISLSEAGHQMSHYISVVSLINLGVGVLAGIIVYVTGLPNPILWGVAVTLLNFVPFIGPVVSFAAVAVVSLITFDSWPEIVAPVVAFGAIHFLEGEFVTSLVLGRTWAVHPVMIILSILVWGWMWGLAGAFLAVPILLTTLITVRKVLMLETDATVSGVSAPGM